MVLLLSVPLSDVSGDTPLLTPMPLATAVPVAYELPSLCLSQFLDGFEITEDAVTLHFDDIRIYKHNPEQAAQNGLVGYYYIVVNIRVINLSAQTVQSIEFTLTDSIGNVYYRLMDLHGFAPPLLTDIAPQTAQAGRLIYHVPEALSQNKLWFSRQSDSDQLRFNVIIPTPTPTGQ